MIIPNILFEILKKQAALLYCIPNLAYIMGGKIEVKSHDIANWAILFPRHKIIDLQSIPLILSKDILNFVNKIKKNPTEYLIVTF